MLAYVYFNGDHINYQLVAQGYGRVYDSQFAKRDTFYDAEATAQEQKHGAWQCRNVETATPTPTPRPDGGDSPRTLEVVQVHEDAEGNDHENENDEYVVFENTGDESLELTGWTVPDEADHTFQFPDGFTLDVGERVTLFTGSGEDSKTGLYWGSDSAIWNNNGDTVYVHDASGTLVEEYEY